jgi:hypothetical protein
MAMGLSLRLFGGVMKKLFIVLKCEMLEKALTKNKRGGG